MKRAPRRLVFRIAPLICLLIIPLLCVDFFWGEVMPFDQWIQNLSSSETIVFSSREIEIFRKKVEEEKPESLNSLFYKLVKGENRERLESTGFVCDSVRHSIDCVTNQPVSLDTSNMTLYISSTQDLQEETTIRPYARKEDKILLQKVSPVRILQGNFTPPACQYTHKDIPVVIFSSGGFVGNVFHEINEIIIPLFITTRHFKSRVVFIMQDYKLSFLRKYKSVISKLSDYEVMNPVVNQSVHCFPGAVVGLKFHGHLALNSSETPQGYTMHDFKEFLRRAYNLRYSHVSQIKRPTLMLLSRRKTRRFINEDEMVTLMEEVGFRVVVVARAKVFSNVDVFSDMINSCSVFVGAHGAGLTNELFLPDGAVMIQVELIGLEWPSKTYYGNPARAMGVHYLRYKVEHEESSLYRVFGQNHTALTDPKGHSAVVGDKAGRAIYLDMQNVRINLARFRKTLVEAYSLVSDSDL